MKYKPGKNDIQLGSSNSYLTNCIVRYDPHSMVVVRHDDWTPQSKNKEKRLGTDKTKQIRHAIRNWKYNVELHFSVNTQDEMSPVHTVNNDTAVTPKDVVKCIEETGSLDRIFLLLHLQQ